MRIPAIRGTIDRRILVNYRVDPDALSAVLPSPFRPKLVGGYGVGGICLIRLVHARPAAVPFEIGLRSENAAHRIAVEWVEDGMRREGVYVPRRDTSSRLNASVGGRLFAGVYEHANFTVHEHGDRYNVALKSDDGETQLHVVAQETEQLPEASVFPTLAEASTFFERGSLGYSATPEAGRFDGLELRCDTWRVEPLAVEHVASSFFDDPTRFPPGTAAFDCALLMRGIRHAWHARGELCAPGSADAA